MGSGLQTIPFLEEDAFGLHFDDHVAVFGRLDEAIDWPVRGDPGVSGRCRLPSGDGITLEQKQRHAFMVPTVETPTFSCIPGEHCLAVAVDGMYRLEPP